MATWKKWALGFLALVIAAFASCFFVLDNYDDGMCSTEVFDETISPNGKLKIVTYQIDCGATTGFNTQLAIVPKTQLISKDKSSLKGFFVVDTDGGKAPSGSHGGPAVQFTWITDTQLEVRHHKLAHVYRAESYSNGIRIKYETLQ